MNAPKFKKYWLAKEFVKQGHSVQNACRTAKTHKATYYFWKQRFEEQEQQQQNKKRLNIILVIVLFVFVVILWSLIF